MSEEKRQNDALSRRPADDDLDGSDLDGGDLDGGDLDGGDLGGGDLGGGELTGDESLSGESGDERSLLTAYALGELEDGRRAEIAARLPESADDRQTVDDLARLGRLLRSVTAQRSVDRSSVAPADRSSELRAAVLAQLADPSQSQAPSRLPLPERFPRRRFWLPLSLAAALAVTCGTLFALLKTRHGEQVAVRDTAYRAAADTSGPDALADVTEVETADLSVDGRVVNLSKEWKEGRTGEGEAAYLAIDGPTSLGTVTEPSQPRSGQTADFASEKKRVAKPALGLGRSKHGHGNESGEAPGGFFDFSSRRGSGGRGHGGGDQGGGQSPEQSPRGYGGRGMHFGEADSGQGPSGGKQSGEQGEQDLQRRRIVAAMKAQERMNHDPSLQEQRGREAKLSGKNAQGQHNGEEESRRRQTAGNQGPQTVVPQIIVQEEEAELPNVGGQHSKEHYWFYQAANGNTPPPTTQRGDREGGGKNGSQVEMAEGLLVGGRGLPETPQAGEDHLSYREMAGQNTESYPTLVETPFRKSTEYPLSTFSIDVDTASYTNVRRFLNSRAMPPRNAVRVEELINYFQYSYPQPEGDVPFSITTDVADCPWQAQHRLLRVGLKGREIPADQRPASNLVFLLDVSGSMDAPNKLPLVKEAMSLLVDKLTENDRVAIVVYAGNSGLVLPPTNGENKEVVREAISRLVAGGSTNGGQGLQMAYDTAQAHFIKGGTNRVILATDGDFNVGVVDQNDLVRLIEEKAQSGVFLSALGFGIGNLKDGTLEKLADKGNGNYAYIDTLGEARRVLVEQLSGTLVTIAKDVKLQIEFNPAQAAEYRLIGYEDRLMPDQDFHDDRKDAGEIGAGHSVTALYEIVPAATVLAAGGEPLKYQRSANLNLGERNLTAAAATGELATLKLRYKQPDGEQSRLIEHVVTDRRPPQAEASHDMNFAAAVAAFGMLLRDSPYRGDASYQQVLSLAEQGLTGDASGYRSEFVQLVRQAKEISGKE